MTFIEKLRKRQQEANSMLCVGLDTDRSLIPKFVYVASPALEFNRLIVKAISPFVCAYKINIAFYSSDTGEPIYPLGEYNLLKTIEFIHERYPDIPVILDAKRGDIGNTAEKYAQEVFDRFGADAVTVNPYLGQDSCQPFLDRKDKGIIILCKTSNPDSKEFQNLLVYSEEFDRKLGVWIRKTPVPLYCRVAEVAAKHWNKNGNCLLVVGATHPQELHEVRKIVGNMPILIPAIGAQGGDLEAVIRYGLDSTGFGLIINSSRGVIYDSTGKNFAEAAARKAKKLRDKINKLKEAQGWKNTG